MRSVCTISVSKTAVSSSTYFEQPNLLSAAATSSKMSPPHPHLHVTAALPSTIAFSSPEVPYLEIGITSQHNEPVIIQINRSRLWPHHRSPALTLNNVRTGEKEYIPHCDPTVSGPVLPIAKENRGGFLQLRPYETSVVKVNYRPFDEPYDYDNPRYKDLEYDMPKRMKMMMVIGMQWLRAGEEYDLSIQSGVFEGFMKGDLNELLEHEGANVEWRQDGYCKVVPGEKCRFRVEA